MYTLLNALGEQSRAPGEETEYGQDWKRSFEARNSIERENALRDSGSVDNPLRDVPTVVDNLARRDKRVAQTGVDAPGMRAALSFADNDKERGEALTRAVGEGNWALDRYGNYTVLPKGMEALGQKPDPYGRPTRVDKPLFPGPGEGAEPQGFAESVMSPFIDMARGFEPLNDTADIAQEIPAIAASTAAGMAVGGPGTGLMGALRGGLAAAAAGGVAATATELTEEFAGVNDESVDDIYPRILGTMVESGLGELGGDVLGTVGRHLNAPNANKLTDVQRGLYGQATDVGAVPTLGAVTGGAVVGRYENILSNVLGDARDATNSAALLKEIKRVQDGAGPASPANPAGTILGEVKAAKAAWQKDTITPMYKAATDGIGQGAAVVPTGPIRAAAKRLLERQVTLKDPKKRMSPLTDKQVTELEDLMELPEYIPGSQVRVLEETWNARGGSPLVNGDLDTLQIAKLKAGMQASFDMAPLSKVGAAYEKRAGKGALKKELDRYAQANADYKSGLEKFQGSMIDTLAKSQKAVKELESMEVADIILSGKGKPKQIEDILNNMTETGRRTVRGVAMNKTLMKITRKVDDNPLDTFFDATTYRQFLKDTGEPTLKVLFGDAAVKDLHRLGNVLALVKPNSGLSGGLIAAEMVVHPIKNAIPLLRLKFFNALMSSPRVREHIILGAMKPHTKAGQAALQTLGAMQRSMIQSQVQPDTETKNAEAEYKPNGSE